MTAPLNSLPKASSELEPDEFELFDLTVTVEGGNFVCRHHLGQGFKVEGEDLVFPEGGRFSLYAMAALLPLIAADRAETLYPDMRQTQPETSSESHQTFCPEGSGALFRYRNRDLWCVAHSGSQPRQTG